MLMFLSIFAAGMIVVVVCAAIMSTVGTPEQSSSSAEIRVAPSQFFAAEQVRRAVDPSTIPIEVVLSQIERHVRLEQIVAERYLSMPTPNALQSPSESPLVN